ncbi:STT3 domain-containing protein [Chloroflexota bacterium]
MSKIKFSPVLFSSVIIFIFIALALFLRVYLPFDKVFSTEGIKYTSADAYYHMRMVDNLVHNFPQHMTMDPYLIFPGASGEVFIRFFVWLVAVPAWIIGLGSPSQHTIDVVAVYLPAILGALTVIPVYFIGKELFNRWAGVLAAGLIAMLPGEFLGRSILGFTDQHVAETLFTTVTMMFLILAVKTTNHRQITINHLKQRDWATLKKPLIYSLLAAVFMGIYNFTWAGALLFAFIITVYFATQFIVDHLKGKSTDYLSITGITFFFVTLILSLLTSSGILPAVSLTIALLILPVLNVISRLMKPEELAEGDENTNRSAKYVCIAGVVLLFIVLAVLTSQKLFLPFLIIALLLIPVLTVIYTVIATSQIKLLYYPLALLGLGLVGMGLFYIISPSLLKGVLGSFSVFTPSGAHLTTIEMQPLISADYNNAFQLAWGNFPGLIPFDTSTPISNFQNVISFISSSFFLSIIALCSLIYIITRQGSTEKSLLVVWSLVILAATLGQRRFGYYYSVNVALLTGFLLWSIIRWIGEKYFIPRTEEVTQRAGSRRTQAKKGGFPLTENHFIMAVLSFIILIMVFGVYAPNILISIPGTNMAPAIMTGSSARFAPSDAWVSSLNWLKDNTPEPFDNPDAYYELHQIPPLGEKYVYPESAYGVLAWWDYGYWLSRVAHRIPVANPSQNADAITRVASFFTAQDEDSVDEIREELDLSYVVIDHETILSKFWAIATWSGAAPSEYLESYLARQQDQSIRQIVLYSPKYYKSLAARLFNFDGKAVTPEKTPVISYQEMPDEKGNIIKSLTSAQQFDSYEEAVTFISNQESGNFEIVGTNPLVSPVPLEAVEHYRLVHSSENTINLTGSDAIPSIKIFEYVR